MAFLGKSHDGLIDVSCHDGLIDVSCLFHVYALSSAGWPRILELICHRLVIGKMFEVYVWFDLEPISHHLRTGRLFKV